MPYEYQRHRKVAMPLGNNVPERSYRRLRQRVTVCSAAINSTA